MQQASVAGVVAVKRYSEALLMPEHRKWIIDHFDWIQL